MPLDTVTAVRTASTPLGQCIINNGGTEAARVYNYTQMTRRHFHEYVLRLVNAEARQQTRQFNTRFKPKDIDAAVAEVIEHHRLYAQDIAKEATAAMRR